MYSYTTTEAGRLLGRTTSTMYDTCRDFLERYGDTAIPYSVCGQQYKADTYRRRIHPAKKTVNRLVCTYCRSNFVILLQRQLASCALTNCRI